MYDVPVESCPGGAVVASKPSNWTFFSNHGHVYFLLATNEHVTLREVAAEVGDGVDELTKLVEELTRLH